MSFIDDDDDDLAHYSYSSSSCCIPFVRSAGWERIRPPEREAWWRRGWKRLREWSEVVAGPKWKTLIRRFNKKPPRDHRKVQKFQYDPLSYAMNFDDGPGHYSKLDEDFAHCDFSFRYASIPASAKASMDLGKDGTTPFT